MPRHSSQAVKTKAQQQFAQIRHTETPQKTQAFQQDIQQFKDAQNKPLDMTILQHFPKMEDSFYDHKTVSLQRTNQKLLQLKEKLQLELQKENMPYTQQILIDMIQNLKEIIDTKDEKLVKTIIFKIEQGIKQLNNNREGSMDLYKYLNKAILHSKQKTDLFNQRASMPVNANYQSEKYQTPSKNQKMTTNIENYQTTERISEIQQRYTQMRPSEQQTMKRVFFDTALTKKNTLPQNHPNRNIMVTDLYDDFVKGGVGDMNAFINRKLGL